MQVMADQVCNIGFILKHNNGLFHRLSIPQEQ
jgi:hypothetical protein